MNYTTKVLIRSLCSIKKSLKQIQEEVLVLKENQKKEVFPPNHFDDGWKYGNSDDGDFNFRISDR